MLPPVTGPAMPLKVSSSPTEATQNPQSGPRGPLTSTAAEGGAAGLKPETLRAIDPSRQSGPSMRVSPDGSDQTDTRPAGPPPAFVETLLERQARVALDPPAPTGDTPPAKVQAEAGFAESRNLASDAKPPDIDRKE